MSTLELPKPTSIEAPPRSEALARSKDTTLGRILKYKVFIICLSLILVGILLLIIAEFIPLELPKHLLRDIGIVLVTTGLVVFAADYMTRKDFIALLGTELQPLRQEVTTCSESMLKEMQPLKTNVSSLLEKLLQEVAPLKQDIPTLSTTLDDMRNCISLGATMCVLGIKHIHDNRGKSDLHGKLRAAPANSVIKVLGIIASGVSDPEMQEIITQKLNQGCEFQILCLNPESRFVEERAAEEDRHPVEMRKDIDFQISGWKNFVEGRVPEPRRAQIKLRCYDSSSRYFLFITQTVVVVGFYLGRGRGANNLHLELEVKNDGIATAFIQHFDSLWEGAKGSAATLKSP